MTDRLQRLTKDEAATAIVSEWLAAHPDLAADLRGRAAADFRDAVTSFLYPYDRFPLTLAALVRSALDRVDWEAVFAHVEDPP